MGSGLSSEQWQARYIQQARWTRDLRQYLYSKYHLGESQRVLDVGCGPGALLPELLASTQGKVFGLDINLGSLILASDQFPQGIFIQADAHHIPFPSQAIDIAVCHYLLLWVDQPSRVLGEMSRVVRPGGMVLALAEPDYGGRIDYPHDFIRLGEIQRQSLLRQRADPLLGRKLAGLFQKAGLLEIESGVLGGQWAAPPSLEEWESEWDVLEADLAHLASEHIDLEVIKSQDWLAWQAGERILYVPTFYASGKVPRS